MSKKRLKAKLRKVRDERDRLGLILRNINREVRQAIDSADYKRWDTALHNALIASREFSDET